MSMIDVHSKRTAPDPIKQAVPQISFHQFPVLFDKHWNGDPSTRSVEKYGADFVCNGMPADLLFGFVRMVVGWGGDGRVGTNFMRRNATRLIEVHEEFLKCDVALKINDLEEAIKIMKGIPGLGISYASKLLKFLAPDQAVVLDSHIETGLGYKRTLEGYLEFASNCRDWANVLNTKGIKCSRSQAGTWRVSDVEMAIFKHVRP